MQHLKRLRAYLAKEFSAPYTPYILSGGAMALSLHPFYAWPLAIAALAPYFYASAQAQRPVKNIFWGGFLVGAMTVAPFLYFSLIQLPFETGGSAFVYAVRFAGVATVVAIGVLFGVTALLYRRIRTNIPLLNAAAGAALYCLCIELPIVTAFQGYYYGSLSHALVHIPLFLSFATVGGSVLASFVAAICSSAIAEMLRAPRTRVMLHFMLVGLCIALGAQAYANSLRSHAGAQMSVSVIQAAPERPSDLFGAAEHGSFEHDALRALIASAPADVVVYPFSPAGIVYEGSEPVIPGAPRAVEERLVGEWLSRIVPPTTTVMVWDTLSQDGVLYDELAFWKEGKKETYRKHVLYAFSDFTPEFARALGVQKSPADIVPGDGALPEVAGSTISGLVCSEVNRADLARIQARGSSVFFAIGWDAMFIDDISASYTLAAARYRAAENNTPVIRGNLYGPSAIIRPDGSLQTYAPFGQRAVITGAVGIGERTRTLYSYSGDAPVYALMWLLVGATVVRRRNP